MKKIAILSLILVTIFTLSSCKNKTKEENQSLKNNETEIINNVEPKDDAHVNVQNPVEESVTENVNEIVEEIEDVAEEATTQANNEIEKLIDQYENLVDDVIGEVNKLKNKFSLKAVKNIEKMSNEAEKLSNDIEKFGNDVTTTQKAKLNKLKNKLIKATEEAFSMDGK